MFESRVRFFKGGGGAAGVMLYPHHSSSQGVETSWLTTVVLCLKKKMAEVAEETSRNGKRSHTHDAPMLVCRQWMIFSVALNFGLLEPCL